MNKNVYQGYLSSAEVRSSSERNFEKFCEKCNAVDWVYKNGDKGNEYLSIVYADNSNRQKNFYPDYIIGVKGDIWIVETKGGIVRYDKKSEELCICIDNYSEDINSDSWVLLGDILK